MEMNGFDSVKSGSRVARLNARRSGKRHYFGTIVFVVAVIVIACLVGGILALVATAGRGPRIPKLIGLTFEEAKKKAVERGFSIEIDPSLDSDVPDVGKLKVEEQDPKPGCDAEKGELITVRLKGLFEKSPQEERETSSKKPGGLANEPNESEPTNSGQIGEQQQGHLVCLDPGHSANCPASEIDPVSGLDVADNGGAPGERKAMWELAVKLKAKLEASGYRVRLTKDSADAYSSLRTRADIGNTCEIMVRLHFDSNLHAILYPGEGQYKSHGGTTVFVDPQVARSSAVLAEALYPFLKDVGIKQKTNDSGGTSNNTGPAYVVSVLSRVPVVLIENDPSMVKDNPDGQEQVADAILKGINAYFASH